MTTAYMEQHATKVHITDGVAILAGLWLIIAPFVLNYSGKGGSTANDVTIGIAVFALASWQMLGDNFKASLISWILVALGAWLVVTPFIFGLASGSAAMWNDIVLGVIVAGVALTGSMFVPKEDEI